MVYHYYLQYDIYDQYAYGLSKYEKVAQKEDYHDDEEFCDYPYDPDFDEDNL
jgi:hypothetical protein